MEEEEVCASLLLQAEPRLLLQEVDKELNGNGSVEFQSQQVSNFNKQ